MVTACLAVLIDEVFVEGWRGLILQGKREQVVHLGLAQGRREKLEGWSKLRGEPGD
jgi:hypothetical protein